MYCKNCGEVLVEGQALCKKCGTPVVGFDKNSEDVKFEKITKTHNEETEKELSKMVEKATKSDNTKKKKNPFAVIFLILFILCVIAGFITYDKIVYKLSSDKEVEEEREVVTTPEAKEDKELITKKDISISYNGAEHKLYLFYYKSTYPMYVFDETTQTNSLISVDSVDREVYLDNTVIIENDLVDVVNGDKTFETIANDSLNSVLTYILKDTNTSKEYLSLVFKDSVKTDGNFTTSVKFNIYDENSKSIFEKEVRGSSNAYYLTSANEADLNGRKTTFVNNVYNAYYTEDFNAHYEIRDNALYTLENNGDDILEKKYTIVDGSIQEEVQNTFLKTDVVIGCDNIQ